MSDHNQYPPQSIEYIPEMSGPRKDPPKPEWWPVYCVAIILGVALLAVVF